MSVGNIWKGTESYKEEDWAIYGGRENDLERFEYNIRTIDYTVLLGQSGVGKSSFLRAGLYSQVQSLGIYPIHIPLDSIQLHNLDITLESLKKLAISTISHDFPDLVSRLHYKNISLLPFFKKISTLLGGKKLVIVFDQFEQVFIQGANPDHQKNINWLLYKLSCFIEKTETRVGDEHLYHSVISLRDDYYLRFKRIIQYFPHFDTNKFQLAPLVGEEAIRAIMKPVKLSVNPNILGISTAKEIMEKVSLENNKEFRVIYNEEWMTQPLNESSFPTVIHWSLKEVSPLILSLYCQKLQEKLRPNISEINSDHVKEYDVHNLVSEYFYENTRDLSPQTMDALVSLVSDSGDSRQSLPESHFLKISGNNKDALKKLTDRRLIRLDNSLGAGNQVHLIHDVFISCVAEERQKLQEEKDRIRQKEIEDTERAKRVRLMAWLTSIITFTTIIFILLFYSQLTNTRFQRQQKINAFLSLTNSWTTHDLQRQFSIAQSAFELVSETDNAVRHKLKSNLTTLYYQNRFYQMIINDPGKFYDLNLSVDSKLLVGSTYGNALYMHYKGDLVWTQIVTGKYKDYAGLPIMASALSPSAQNFTLAGYKGKGISQLYFGQLSNGQLTDSTDSFQGTVSDIEYLDENRIVVSTYRPGGIFMVSVGDPEKLIALDPDNMHDGDVQALAYEKAKKLIYSAGEYGVIKVWNSDGSFVRNLYEQEGCQFEDIELSKDRQYLLAGSCNNDALILDLQGEEKQRFSKHNDRVTSVEFSKDGDYILTGGADGMAYLWHRSGDLVQEFVGEANLAFWDVELTPDNKYLLTAGQDGAVKKWSTSGRLLDRWGKEDTIVAGTIFANEKGGLNEYRLSESEYFYNKVIRWNGQRETDTLDLGPNDPTSIKSTGNYLAIKADRNEKGYMIFAFNHQSQSIVDSHFIEDDILHDFTLHPSQPIITYFVGAEGKGYQWNFDTGKVTDGFSLEKDNWQVTSLAYSPDGKYLVYGSSGELVYYDCSTGVPSNPQVKYEHEDSKFIYALDFSSDAKHLASGSDDGRVIIWSVPGFERELTLHSPKRSGWVKSVQFSPDGQQLLATYGNGDAFLFRLSDGIAVQEFRVLNQESGAAINGDFGAEGQSVIIQYASGYTRVWEIRESLESFLERGEFDRLSKEELKAYGIE